MDEIQSYLNEVTILFVDDEDGVRESFEILLNMWAKKAYVASNGREGLEAYKTYHPDIIITDIKMPVMTGLEMIGMIKKENPDFPIIVTTAFQEPEFLLEAIELKVNGYIVKPIPKKELKKQLEAIAKVMLIEKELSRVHALNQLYLDVSGVLMIALDKDATITTINKTGCDILGLNQDEVIGKNWFEIGVLPQEKIEELRAYFFKLITGDTAPSEQNHDNELITKNGEHRFFSWSNVLLKEEEQITGILGSALDITQLHVAQQQLRENSANLEKKVDERTKELSAMNERLQELDKLKTMFIASMSHELRTPLNSIIGFTGVVLQGLTGTINDAQRDYLTRVKNAGQHLLSLILNVIDISKIEAGHIKAEPKQFLLNELLFELKDVMDIIAAKKKLNIVIDSPKDIMLNTDKKRVFQCLLNYVSNAIKFTDRAGIIEIKVTDYEKDVEITIKDSGIGINQKNIEKLFQAFERLESHLKVLAGGTGLGLYLTKKIVQDLLLGDISLKSVEGEGSTFGLRIPKNLRSTSSKEVPMATLS